MAIPEPTQTDSYEPSQALSKSEERYKLLLEALPHGMQVCDTDGVITFSNPAHAKMLGYEDGELVGKRIWELLDDKSEQDKLRKYLAFLVNEQPTPTPYLSRNRTNDGKTIDVQVDWTYQQDENGDVLGFISVITDISEREQIHEDLHQAHAKLKQRIKEATREVVHINQKLREEVQIRQHAQTRESEFGRILDESLNEIYIFDAGSLRFIQVNRGARENLGYSMEELHSLTPVDLITSFDAETYSELVAPLRKGLQNKISFETVQCRKDGSIYPIEVHLQRANFENRPCFVAVILDISLRKQAEDKLAEKTAQLQAMFDAIPDLVFIIDPEGLITEFRSGSQDNLYVSPDLFLGRRMHEVLPPEIGVQFDSAQEKIRNLAKVASFEYTLTIQGQKKWFQARLLPYINKEIVALIEDISERKHLEEQLQQHQEQLTHIVQLNTMGEIAMGLSHELNQPLGAILLYASAGQQALADTESADPKQLQELFERLTKHATQAGKIIRRLRDQNGKKANIYQQVELTQLIKKLLYLMESDLHKSEIRIEQHLESAIPKVKIDEIQIQQVLLNLIRNALDAMVDMQSDQRVLSITTLQTTDGMIEVAVCDSGPGIPIESADRVYDAFFSTKSDGMGMGLAISRTIIEAHGGRMWMTPNLDHGVTFHFTLPIAEE